MTKPKKPHKLKKKDELVDAGIRISPIVQAAAKVKRNEGRWQTTFSATKALFRPAKHPQDAKGTWSVAPSGMAMDDNSFLGETSSWGARNIEASMLLEGQAFLGYPTLAIMAQRTENRAIVGILSTEMTRKWYRLVSKGKDRAKSDKIAKITDRMKDLDVQGAFKSCAEGDGFFGRGHLFLEFKNGGWDDKEELKTSVGDGRDDVSKSKVGRNNPLIRVKYVEAVWTYPIDYNTTNPLRTDWFKPSTWQVMGTTIHSTRLLRFVLNEVPDLLKPAYSFGGLSMSQMARPYVDNWLKTRQSTADLVRQFTLRVLATNLKTTLQQGSDQSLYDRAELLTDMESNNGVVMLDKDTEAITQISAPIGGLHELQAQSQEHMCLVGDTKIFTRRGEIPICEVTIDDEVMTRKGWAPVAWSGITGYTRQLVEISTANSSIRATPCHPIWLPKINEFVPARNVRVGHILSEAPINIINTARQSCGEDVGGARTSIDMRILELDSCIEPFGKHIEDLYQKAWTFITLMGTQLIINLVIWNSLLVHYITNIISAMEELASINVLLSFIKNVNIVNQNSRQFGLITASVGTDVKIWPYLDVKVRESEEVRPYSNAAIARNGFLTPLSENPDLFVMDAAVVRTVNIVNVMDEPVYNLTIADGQLPEFFANGILVHNSLPGRIPTVKLSGISPTGLNASSDGELEAFDDTIASMQVALFRDPLRTVLGFIQLSLFDEIDDDIDFEPIPLVEERPIAKAQRRLVEAQYHAAYVEMGAIDGTTVRRALAEDPDGPYPGLEDEELPGEGGNDPWQKLVDGWVEEDKGRDPWVQLPQVFGQDAKPYLVSALRHHETGEIVHATGPHNERHTDLRQNVSGNFKDWRIGFINHRGDFLDRRQAAQYAAKHDLVRPETIKFFGYVPHEVISEHIKSPWETGQDATGLVPYRVSWGSKRIGQYDPEFFQHEPEHLRDERGKSVAERDKLVERKPANESLDIEGKPGHIYRGMSHGEFEDFRRSGQIRSKGDYNFNFQKGLTYFSAHPRSAETYSNSFAPSKQKPDFDKPAYVVEAKHPGEEHVHHVPGTDPSEIGVKGALPKSYVTRIWRGRVIARDPGEQFPSGGGVSPSARLHWEQLP